MKNFNCNICHKKHQILNSFTCPIPSQITDLSDESRARRVIELSSIGYLIDKSYLIIKGEIRIQVQPQTDEISILAYCSIPNEIFKANFESLKKGETIKIEGQLISELPFYERSQGLRIEIEMLKTRALGIINIIENSQLYQDQLSPISNTRTIELMQNLYHHPTLHENQDNTEKNNQSLSALINHAQTEFIEKGRKFLINVISEGVVLFQLISSELLEEPQPSTIGFHLANDALNDDYLIVKSQMEDYDDFKKYTVDGVEIYQTDYKNNRSQLFEDVKKVSEDIFQVPVDNCKFEINELWTQPRDNSMHEVIPSIVGTPHAIDRYRSSI